MSDTAAAATGTGAQSQVLLAPIAADPAPLAPAAPRAGAWNATMGFKAVCALGIGGSVFGMVLMGLLPPETYLTLIVTPGLAALGVHRSS